MHLLNNQQDYDLLILHIRANPDDPQLFQLFYCEDCREIVPAGGLFPSINENTGHLEHHLAWLPGQDSVPPGPPEGLIQQWLAAYRPNLTSARYTELAGLAARTGSSNWVWVLQAQEQQAWLEFLDGFLQQLARQWVQALAGHSSVLFPEPQQLWSSQPVAAYS